jgi:hypothetical protein
VSWLKSCVFIALLLLVDGVTPRRSLLELPSPLPLSNHSENFDTNTFNSYVNEFNQPGTDSYIHYEQQNALSSLINMAYEAIFYKNTSTPGVVCNYSPLPVTISASDVLPPLVIQTINDLIIHGEISLPNNCTDSNVLQALANAMDQANINAQGWKARPVEILGILGIVLGTVLCMFCWCPRVIRTCLEVPIICGWFEINATEVRIRRNRVHPQTSPDRIQSGWYTLTTKRLRQRLRQLFRYVNSVMPFGDGEFPVNIEDIEIVVGGSGSRKNTNDFTKTKEKYGTRCIYLSKKDAKYLKVNGEFVAYKTAIKFLTKKITPKPRQNHSPRRFN